MRIGFIQMTPDFGRIKANVNQAMDLILATPADLLVLPEFFSTGYLFSDTREVAKLSEQIDNGFTTLKLLEVARKTDTAVVAGIAERDGAEFFNTAVMVTPEGDVHRYRKTHLFDREKLFFQPGNTGFRTFVWRGIRIGLMICFDWYFPESARTLALAGAQIIAHPSNLVLPHCPRAMVTRCLENRVFSITSNRSGEESRGGCHLKYIGNSRIIGPLGHVLGEAGEEETSVVVVDVDPHLAESKKVTARNDLFEDRRPEYYSTFDKERYILNRSPSTIPGLPPESQ